SYIGSDCLGNLTSSTITINTGVPQGCILSPALFTLFTHDCKPIHSSSNTIVKFADDTTIVGRISDNNESHYRDGVQHLIKWCGNNDLVLNTAKIKEIVVDYRRAKKTTLPPLHINGEEVERVNDIKFLGLHITKDLTWTINTSHLVKKAQQRLFFLRKLKKANVPTQLLVNFYRSTIESILYHCITVWYFSCTAENCQALTRIVKTAQGIIGTKLLNLDTVYASRLQKRASCIIKDPTHPGHRLFVPLPSGKRYRAIRTHTNRLKNSFFPRAVACVTLPQHTIANSPSLSFTPYHVCC
uniref:Reverse transcriptase domain-containing protein n=1 Tax=Oreochromis aureus TaxID=47969 RepID=A0AAZ1X8U9_OREAU